MICQSMIQQSNLQNNQQRMIKHNKETQLKPNRLQQNSLNLNHKQNKVKFTKQKLIKKQTIKKIHLVLILFIFIIVVLLSLFVLLNQFSPQNHDTKFLRRDLLQEQNQNSDAITKSITNSQIVKFFQYLLNLVSNLANVLKIIFQLTALLFIITDLVNFWNLASIYIFLPIQIPKFAKQILINVWTQFNQPILSFFNVKFDTITFNDQQKTYQQGNQYLSALEVDISQIAFEPLFILFTTALQLILITTILNWIKNNFKKIHHKVHEGINLQTFLDKNQGNKKNQNLFETLFKNNKVFPIQQEQTNKKQAKKTQSQQNGNKQQSMKNIFDPDTNSVVTLQHITILSNQQENNKKPEQIDKINQQSKNYVKQLQNNTQEQTQLKFICIINNIIKTKLNQSKSLIKNKKHWSQTIEIDIFQIISALLISFMPIFFLPLFNSLFYMNYQSLKEKFNLICYFGLISAVILFPFVYLVAKIKYKKIKIKKQINKKNKDSRMKQSIQTQCQMNKPQEKKRQITKVNQGQMQKSKNIKKVRKVKKSTQQKNVALINIQLKQQTFQTFFLFIMNLTIPICAGIQSNPIYFLTVNFFIHLLFLFSQVIFYPKRTFSNKCKKYNKLIQKLIFLLYHLCFIGLHFFNSIKKSWVRQNIMTEDKAFQVENIFGILIISLFAFGGLHQMIEFLIGILYDGFKIIYMIIHVIVGGYDLSELQKQMKELDKNYNFGYKQKFQQDKKGKIEEQIKKPIVNAKQDAPKNTIRSLEQLQADFEIQIVKNQIMLNKLNIQKLQQTQT